MRQHGVATCYKDISSEDLIESQVPSLETVFLRQSFNFCKLSFIIGSDDYLPSVLLLEDLYIREE